LTELVALFAVPHEDVGVGTDGDRPLAGIEPENLRRRGRRDLDEAVHRDAPLTDAAVPEEVEPRLDTRHPVRDLREVVFTELLLSLLTEWAMVGGDDLQIVRLQPTPEVLLHARRPKRRRADVLCALEVGSREVVLREEEILRTRLGVRR